MLWGNKDEDIADLLLLTLNISQFKDILRSIPEETLSQFTRTQTANSVFVRFVRNFHSFWLTYCGRRKLNIHYIQEIAKK